jgi:hypothetical protein
VTSQLFGGCKCARSPIVFCDLLHSRFAGDLVVFPEAKRLVAKNLSHDSIGMSLDPKSSLAVGSPKFLAHGGRLFS